MSIKRRYK